MPRNGTDKLTTSLLACGVLGGFGFIAVFLIAGAIRPHYSPLYHHVSSLSLGDDGSIQIANFVVTGILIIACALGLRRALSSGRGSTWGPILVGMFGLGLVGAGAFVTDPGFGYPPGASCGVPATVTVHGNLVASSVALFSGGYAGLFQRLSIVAGWTWIELLTIRTTRRLSPPLD